MATLTTGKVDEFVFEWEGRDRQGRIMRGEARAAGENQVQAALRRQGLSQVRIRKRQVGRGPRIRPKDIALFTRQMATMMKAGVPLLQSFDIVGRGNPNPNLARLLNDVRMDVETGTSLSAAFRTATAISASCGVSSGERSSPRRTTALKEGSAASRSRRMPAWGS